jgi:hypothetical protein
MRLDNEATFRKTVYRATGAGGRADPAAQSKLHGRIDYARGIGRCLGRP